MEPGLLFGMPLLSPRSAFRKFPSGRRMSLRPLRDPFRSVSVNLLGGRYERGHGEVYTTLPSGRIR